MENNEIIKIPIGFMEWTEIKTKNVYLADSINHVIKYYFSGIKNDVFYKLNQIKAMSKDKYLQVFIFTLAKVAKMTHKEYEETLNLDVVAMFNNCSVESLKKLENKSRKGVKVYNFDLKQQVYRCYAMRKFDMIIDNFYKKIEEIKIDDSLFKESD